MSLREHWRYGTQGRREIGRLERNWATVLDINQQLGLLISAHHSAGALDGALVGDKCPVCVASGVLYGALTLERIRP